ncbi:class C beta-lactamase-related serine hydrolase [bacterium]|nr:MAG: class C beta-lactamase-related serine hydrolase [bacterium]
MNRYKKGYVFLVIALWALAGNACISRPSLSTRVWAAQMGLSYDGNESADSSISVVKNDEIEKLMRDIAAGKWINVHGLMIIKDRRIVAEGYWNGSHRAKLHDIRSASKSIASILTGIAVDRSYISSPVLPVYDFFPEYEPSYPSWLSEEEALEWKKSLTIECLLNMTSGYEYDDWADNFRGEMEIVKSRDWLGFAADSRISKKPGSFYAYNTASLVLLSGIISRTSKLGMKEFTEKELFTPLGIERWKWFNRKGVIYMGGNLWLTLRDMAKIGLLLLNNGKWQGKQIISEAWIHEITRELKPYEPSWQKHEFFHHYLWWRFDEVIEGERIRAFYASGNGGQTIMFVPKLDMVVAITTGNYNTTLEGQSIQIIRKVILPAFIN